MSVDKILGSIPFYVEQASYCVSYHHRNLCRQCTDTGCTRLDEAAQLLADFRKQRDTRSRVNRQQ